MMEHMRLFVLVLYTRIANLSSTICAVWPVGAMVKAVYKQLSFPISRLTAAITTNAYLEPGIGESSCVA
jgi:hypothetical protein